MQSTDINDTSSIQIILSEKEGDITDVSCTSRADGYFGASPNLRRFHLLSMSGSYLIIGDSFVLYDGGLIDRTGNLIRSYLNQKKRPVIFLLLKKEIDALYTALL